MSAEKTVPPEAATLTRPERITLQMGFPRGWEARCFWLSGRVQPAKSVPRFVDNAIASARSIPRWRCRQRVGILVPNGHELRDGFLEVLYAAEGTTADTHRRSFLTPTPVETKRRRDKRQPEFE